MWFKRKRDQILSVLLVLPSALAILVFVYAFIALTTYVSFSNWNRLVPDYTFVGTANYLRLFQNPRFLITLRNLGVFTGLFVGGSLTLGFLLACFWTAASKRKGSFAPFTFTLWPSLLL